MKPNRRRHTIHLFFEYIAELNLPYLVVYILIFIFLGSIFVAIGRGTIQRGSEFSYFQIFASAIFPVGALAILHFAAVNSPSILIGYIDNILDIDKDLSDLLLSFTTISPRLGNVLIIAGVIIGGSFGNYLSKNPNLTASNSSLFSIFQTSLVFAFAVPATFFLLRQLFTLQRIFRLTPNIEIWNLEPIYEISRYTATIGASVFLLTSVGTYIIAPESYSEPLIIVQNSFFFIFVLLYFLVPLSGISQKISNGKSSLIKEINFRIHKMYSSIHQAQDIKDYSKIESMESLLRSLQMEHDAIDAISPWPWKKNTFRGLLSTFLIPVMLSLFDLALRKFFGF